MQWIASHIQDGHAGPVLCGEDSTGHRILLVQNPIDALDPVHLNFVMLREGAEGDALTEHFFFMIPRTHATRFFEKVALMLAQTDLALVESFCEGIIPVLRTQKDTV